VPTFSVTIVAGGDAGEFGDVVTRSDTSSYTLLRSWRSISSPLQCTMHGGNVSPGHESPSEPAARPPTSQRVSPDSRDELSPVCSKWAASLRHEPSVLAAEAKPPWKKPWDPDAAAQRSSSPPRLPAPAPTSNFLIRRIQVTPRTVSPRGSFVLSPRAHSISITRAREPLRPPGIPASTASSLNHFLSPHSHLPSSELALEAAQDHVRALREDLRMDLAETIGALRAEVALLRARAETSARNGTPPW
jgi:hypothetical protein